jgi:hypothetical protein
MMCGDENMHDNLFYKSRTDAVNVTQHIIFLTVDVYHMFHILYTSFILFYISLPP